MPTYSWTERKDIISHLSRMWESGKILSSMLNGREIFPVSIPVKGPKLEELGELYKEARDWARVLLSENNSGLLRVTTRRIKHRTLGHNEMPDRIWVDTADDAINLLRKKNGASRFAEMIDFTCKSCPPLLSHLERHPLEALALGKDWERCVSLSLWMARNPMPDIYIRQVDLPGIDTKFIERHKGLLARLFDILLPDSSLNMYAQGQKNFEARYGFKTEPLLVRIRLPLECPAFPKGVTEVTLPSEEFTNCKFGLEGQWSALFVENKTNFLAIPRARNLLIIWAKGYGFEFLKDARWLQDGKIYYWGDIDTHGFAILNQFRSVFPSAESILMDRNTLTLHRELWVEEPSPTSAYLDRLNNDETELYRDLYTNTLGTRVRLEQERIGFSMIMDRMKHLFEHST